MRDRREKDRNDLDYQAWTEFYQEFADKLLLYRHNRTELIEHLKTAYKRISINFPKVEGDGSVVDLDPFSIFAFFNKGITDTNRKRVLTEFKETFGVSAPVPLSFPGIPVVMNLNATFFQFKENRGEKDIDYLWEVFEQALNYADFPSASTRESFVEAYNQAKDLKGNRWKLTMALFWMRPFAFINLDTLNRLFLAKADFLPKSLREKIQDQTTIPEASVYLDFCRDLKQIIIEKSLPFKDFPQLSYYVWQDSQREKDLNKAVQGVTFSTTSPSTTRYWIYAPGTKAEMWEDYRDEGIMAIGWSEIGDLDQYESKDTIRQAMVETYGAESSYIHSAHAAWQFAHEMKPGDIVYAKQGQYSIVGRGVVDSAYEFDDFREHRYKNIRKVDWTHQGDWPYPGTLPMKTLTEITSYIEQVNELENLTLSDETGEDDIDTDPPQDYPLYDKEDFLNEVYFEDLEYDRLKNLLLTHKNIVLQGAPGVGKTYMAERLAYSVMGEKNPNRVMLVQFHQSYSYEDFIMGFRPVENGFELRKGTFYDFCKRAEIDSKNTPYFFIIDEINRGNLSKIFGEVFMLIEKDKRDYPLQLLYVNEKFSIPSNIHIIGMMNTADRSLALLDYALRRRFAFYDIDPVFETKEFRNYQKSLNDPTFDRMIGVIKKLNLAIQEDSSLGKGFRIGHSFFCDRNKPSVPTLQSIVEYQIIPLLEEYWFDDDDLVTEWSKELRDVLP